MYIGEKLIKEITSADPYNSMEMLHIVYSDGTSEDMTKRLVDISKSEEASNATALREARTDAVAKEVLTLLLSWGLPVQDINYLTQKIGMSINASIQAAESKLWGKDNLSINLVDVDRILTKIKLSDILPPSDTQTSTNQGS